MQGLEIYLPLVEKHGACFWSIALFLRNPHKKRLETS